VYIDQEASASSVGIEPCARCRAKGAVVCPECHGTSERRNSSYVIVDRCHKCDGETRGFITCPNCLGKKVVDADRLREIRKLESENMRSNPAVWGFTIPTPPRRVSVDVTAKTEALECEVVELRNLISLAESKADEMLKVGANDEISQPQAVNMPAELIGVEQLGEFSAGKSSSNAAACFRGPESYSKNECLEAEVMNLQFRRADPSDAEEAITLIYNSGPHELDYAFAVGHHKVLDLLRIAFVDGSSTLGYGSQVVAVLDGHVVGIGAFHNGANYGRANRKVLYPVARFYGPLTGAGVLTRLTQLERQLWPPPKKHDVLTQLERQLWPPPKKHDVFVQHLGVREDLRGNGIGTALLAHQIEMARARHFRRFILDVAVTNPRAQVLYERLGFRVVEEREWHITSSTAHVPDSRRMEMLL